MLPEGKKTILVRWVFKLKVNLEGKAVKNKDRLVAKSFLHKQGVDYDEVFSLVARHETIRLVIVLPYNRGCPLFHLDFQVRKVNQAANRQQINN